MTKQAFSQLRQKIKPDAFMQLNDNYVRWFYSDDNFKKYRGYKLLSIDGSITEIPNTISNREHFGYYHNQSDRQQARAMVCVAAGHAGCTGYGHRSAVIKPNPGILRKNGSKINACTGVRF